MSQMIARRASRSAVATNRKRPFAYSAAISFSRSAVTDLRVSFHSGALSAIASLRNPAEEAARLEDVLRRYRGVDLLQRRVVLRPEKRERRDQRAGADAGDELELGPRSGSRPAVQQSRRVGPVVAAARDRQENRGRERPFVPLFRQELLFYPDRLERDSAQLGHVAAADVTHARHARNLGLGGELGRHRGKTRSAPLRSPAMRGQDTPPPKTLPAAIWIQSSTRTPRLRR